MSKECIYCRACCDKHEPDCPLLVAREAGKEAARKIMIAISLNRYVKQVPR